MNSRQKWIKMLSGNEVEIESKKFGLPIQDMGYGGNSKFTPAVLTDISSLRLKFIEHEFGGYMPHDSKLLESEFFLVFDFLCDCFANKKASLCYFNFVSKSGAICFFYLKEFPGILFELYAYDINSSSGLNQIIINFEGGIQSPKDNSETRTFLSFYSVNTKVSFSYLEQINKTFINDFAQKYIVKQEPTNSIFLLASQGFGGLKKVRYDIEKIEDDCLFYYDNYITDKVNSIIDLINTRKKGMFLFHGEKGCGKTSFIKYLINKSSKDFYYINGENALSFSSASFLEFIASNSKNAVFIFEDMEHLITSRETKSNNLISDILNASDGILSDILSPIFIFTFNTQIENIDPAFLRPGRLILEQEFKKLSYKKSNKIAKKIKVKLPENKEYSLAEIFELQNSNLFSARSKTFSTEKKHTIKGFSNNG